MKLLNAIQALKHGATVRDFNHELHALTKVRGVSVDYKNEQGRTYAMYTYKQPMIVKIETLADHIASKADTAPITTAKPCSLNIGRGWITGTYTKIAEIFNANGEKFYVLQDYFGGKIYRRPVDVREHDTEKVQAA